MAIRSSRLHPRYEPEAEYAEPHTEWDILNFDQVLRSEPLRDSKEVAVLLDTRYKMDASFIPKLLDNMSMGYRAEREKPDLEPRELPPDTYSYGFPQIDEWKYARNLAAIRYIAERDGLNRSNGVVSIRQMRRDYYTAKFDRDRWDQEKRKASIAKNRIVFRGSDHVRSEHAKWQSFSDGPMKQKKRDFLKKRKLRAFYGNRHFQREIEFWRTFHGPKLLRDRLRAWLKLKRDEIPKELSAVWYDIAGPRKIKDTVENWITFNISEEGFCRIRDFSIQPLRPPLPCEMHEHHMHPFETTWCPGHYEMCDYEPQ